MAQGPDMKTPSWWEGKVSPGNVISWALILCSTAYMVAFVRADVNALQTFRDETKADIRVIREQRTADRDALLRMEGDIRVIRQLVEQQARQAPTPR